MRHSHSTHPFSTHRIQAGLNSNPEIQGVLEDRRNLKTRTLGYTMGDLTKEIKKLVSFVTKKKKQLIDVILLEVCRACLSPNLLTSH